MQPNYQSDIESDDGAIGPQLPSFVDVVFILLIFFLVLSIVGFGIVETGNYSQDIYTKEEDLSNFPTVHKALHKEIKDFLALSLEKTRDGQKIYRIYSSLQHFGVTIQKPDDYENIRTKIKNNQSVFNVSTPMTPIQMLESTWGPFPDGQAMSNSPLVQRASNNNLIIQATEDFTYHEILQIMRLFHKFNSVYFEVIENGVSS